MLFCQRRIGDGLVRRLSRRRRSYTTFTCSACSAWSSGHSWRAMLRDGRDHAIVFHGYPARRPLRWLAAVAVVLVLAAVAFATTVAGMARRAAPAPAIGIVTTTTAAAGPEAGYVPTVAGPPATDRQGQWLPEPASSTSTSQGAGGGR